MPSFSTIFASLLFSFVFHFFLLFSFVLFLLLWRSSDYLVFSLGVDGLFFLSFFSLGYWGFDHRVGTKEITEQHKAFSFNLLSIATFYSMFVSIV
jgi:hypothetical protein